MDSARAWVEGVLVLVLSLSVIYGWNMQKLIEGEGKHGVTTMQYRVNDGSDLFQLIMNETTKGEPVSIALENIDDAFGPEEF